jgi:hypothetical protein
VRFDTAVEYRRAVGVQQRRKAGATMMADRVLTNRDDKRRNAWRAIVVRLDTAEFGTIIDLPKAA